MREGKEKKEEAEGGREGGKGQKCGKEKEDWICGVVGGLVCLFVCLFVCFIAAPKAYGSSSARNPHHCNDQTQATSRFLTHCATAGTSFLISVA